MPRVKLVVSELGQGQVWIDDQLLATRAVAITAEAGEPTEVTLVLDPAELDIDVNCTADRLCIVRKA